MPAPNNANEKKKPSEFICKLKYSNKLPEIPFEPKLLVIPFEANRFSKYIPNSLEKNFKHPFNSEPDLGISIDLIDPNLYKSNLGEASDVKDTSLLKDLKEVEEATGKVNRMPAKKDRGNVFWLQRTRYMSGHYDGPQFKSDTIEQVGWGKKKGEKEKEMGREEQIRAIEDTFECMKEEPVHPTNPSLKAVEVLPILPDFERWSNAYSQVVFDSNPVDRSSHKEWQEDEFVYARSEAVIKGFQHENRSVVAYLVPKKRKREENEGETEVEYEWIREYSYDVKSGRDFQDTFVFAVEKDRIIYDEISSRVTLLKYKDANRRFIQPSRIVSVQREMNEEELKSREDRLKSLTDPHAEADSVWEVNDK
eukprot:TRINITY_DN14912_c0_g1_i1.p1 TRINITY_DN14912_c0_g1~~TRINITY_DN14912_c0_g1_i1.p1  ORF type:complete len:365 (-),score=167.69 TRINITY_DN14912_c0_g1_i1:47-1141(-)